MIHPDGCMCTDCIAARESNDVPVDAVAEIADAVQADVNISIVNAPTDIAETPVDTTDTRIEELRGWMSAQLNELKMLMMSSQNSLPATEPAEVAEQIVAEPEVQADDESGEDLPMQNVPNSWKRGTIF